VAADVIDVVAGVLRQPDGAVYVARRGAGGPHAGLWEFPGGKCLPGESHAEALARELAEELGIDVRASLPLISVPWPADAPRIRLHGRLVTDWDGSPTPSEHVDAGWWQPQHLPLADMPPADRPIAAALRLPRLFAITPSDLDLAVLSAPRKWLDAQVGRIVQLRLPGRAALQRACVPAWASACHALGIPLVVNDDVATAAALPGVGVHLRQASLLRLNARPLPWGRLVGASCHDSPSLRHAWAIGCDYATLSPVAATASHPDATPLGWAAFGRTLAGIGLPVYAMGGLAPQDLDAALAHGAWGVSGIRGFGWD
jgi:8-oxo-dGTP diphosphatase